MKVQLSSDKKKLLSNRLALCLCAFITFMWWHILLYKYYRFGYTDWDLTFFTQACWGLLHGTQHVSIVGINYFGDHSYWITLLYLPIFFIFSHPLTLVFLKLAAYIISAYLLFRISLRSFSFSISILVMLFYIFFPPNIFTILYDFNPESLAPPFLILIFDKFKIDKIKLYWFAVIMLLMIKENFALLTCVLGIYGLITAKDKVLKKHALGVFVVSITYFIVITMLVIPYFRQLDAHPFLVRYAHLGGSYTQIISNVIGHPKFIIEILLSDYNLNFIQSLFGPLLIPSLLCFGKMIVSIPILLQHLLSSSAQEHSIFYHYGMTFAPLIFLSFIDFMTLLQKKFNKIFFLIVLMVIAFLSTCHFLKFNDHFLMRIDYYQDGLNEKRWEMINVIPEKAGVIATFNYLAPLSMRDNVYAFHKVYNGNYQDYRKMKHSELNVGKTFQVPHNVQYAVIDFRDPWLMHDLKVDHTATAERIDAFLNNSQWQILRNVGSTFLLKR